MDIRSAYNPFTDHYLHGSSSHAELIYNKGKQKTYDQYIRCIIINNILYLRTYYPFDNLSELTLTELNQVSYSLLQLYIKAIKKYIYRHHNIVIENIIYNADNDLLKNLQLAYI
jgi:hypothetical protein